jgi:hypothetical protein
MLWGPTVFAGSPNGKNAALAYLKAYAALEQPRTPEALEVLAFIEKDLPDLPPAVLSVRPMAARWLLTERNAFIGLIQASRIPTCSFDIETKGTPSLDLTHLTPVKQLVRHALEGAKSYEFVDNDQGAAEIYAALFGLAQHLDQDNNLTSGLAAADITQDTLVALSGFISRSPSAEAMTVLTKYFAQAQRPFFHLPEYFENEASRYGNWLLSDPDLVTRKIGALYPKGTQSLAVDQLVTLDAERRMQRTKKWVDAYREHVTRITTAMKKPHTIGLYELRDLDTERKEILENPETAETPLTALLIPAAEKVYERFLVAEAHITLADILCAAGRYRADINSWPEDLEATSKYLGRTFERDPFTGQDFQFKLRKKMPLAGFRAPKWIAKDAGIVHVVDLAKRLARDDQLSADATKAIQRQERREKLQERMDSADEELKK